MLLVVRVGAVVDVVLESGIVVVVPTLQNAAVLCFVVVLVDENVVFGIMIRLVVVDTNDFVVELVEVALLVDVDNVGIRVGIPVDVVLVVDVMPLADVVVERELKIKLAFLFVFVLVDDVVLV
jgi:hypothetical protein